MKSDDHFLLRPLHDDDVSDYAEMLYSSFNSWYWKRGLGRDYFECEPQETRIFYDIYNDLTPGCSIAAFSKDTGQIVGASFYHPREHHVSLGIMSVHPDFWKRGVGSALVNYILDYTKGNDYKSCRLMSSAVNIDSFSLYNRAGFIQRVAYQDMVTAVPANGISETVTGEDMVRKATLGDVASVCSLELEVSGISRKMDYRYAIENPRKALHMSVYDNGHNGIDGFMISVKHPTLNMLGPCVTRSEDVAIALIKKELERFRGGTVLCVAPIQMRKIVLQMYAWHAVNVETHFMQVWGEFYGFKGVNMPSFLPETG